MTERPPVTGVEPPVLVEDLFALAFHVADHHAVASECRSRPLHRAATYRPVCGSTILCCTYGTFWTERPTQFVGQDAGRFTGRCDAVVPAGLGHPHAAVPAGRVNGGSKGREPRHTGHLRAPKLGSLRILAVAFGHPR